MLCSLLFFTASFGRQVEVIFTGEAMCPQTTQAFTDGLNATVSALGIGNDSIMNLTIIPWGNSYYNNSQCGQAWYNKSYSMFCWVDMCDGADPPEDCWDGHVMCQHNDNECYTMMYQACALEVGGLEEGYDFYGCLTQKLSMAWRNGESGMVLLETAAHQCTQNQMIHRCFQVNKQMPANVNIWKTYALRSLQLGSARKGTPWILVDGFVVDQANLLDSVCDAYDGEPPVGCTKRKKTIPSPPVEAVSRRLNAKQNNVTLIEITYYERQFCGGEQVLKYYLDVDSNCNQGFYKDRMGVEFVYDIASNKLSYNEYIEKTCQPENLIAITPLNFDTCVEAGFNWNTYRLVSGPITLEQPHLILDIGYENPTCNATGWYGFSIVHADEKCNTFCKNYDNVQFAQEQRCSPFSFP
jgi:hypothetical protein